MLGVVHHAKDEFSQLSNEFPVQVGRRAFLNSNDANSNAFNFVASQEWESRAVYPGL